jgi:lipoate synthase
MTWLEKVKTKNTTLSEEEFEDQNPYIEEEQTTQWLKEKVQKNKTYIKTNDRVTRTPLKTVCN